MRMLLRWLVFLVLSQTCRAADNDRLDLKSLYDAHQWFALRDAVRKTEAPLFYRSAVACVFNDVHQCEKTSNAVIRSRPQSEDAHSAHSLLATLYFRYGRYRDALAQVDRMLALKGDDSDAKNARLLLAALGNSTQSIGRRRPSKVSLHHEGGNLALPVSINGIPGTYTFDTGAGLSILSESEARRVGLNVRDVESKMGTITGAQVAFRVAVAGELVIGGFSLKQVAFLVFPDDQPPFNELPLGNRGAIGISVLLAFQSFSWGSDGIFQISAPVTGLPYSNLCFDGQNPIAEVQYENSKLSFSLDTGAMTTYLYQPFAAAFPDLVGGQGKKESQKVTGVGSTTQVESSTLPQLQLSIGEFTAALRPAHVFLAQTTEGSKLFHGNLGVDLLSQAQRTTIDFKSMTLTLR